MFEEGLCRRFRWKRNLIVVKGWILESKQAHSTWDLKACLFSSPISSFSRRVTAFCFKTTTYSINQLILREIESTVYVKRSCLKKKKNLSRTYPGIIHRKLKGVPMVRIKAFYTFDKV